MSDRIRSSVQTRLKRCFGGFEVIVICTQNSVDLLAVRIEQAYRRRHPRSSFPGLTPGIWESAASRLLEVKFDKSEIPIDPELFVAVQQGSDLSPDPWTELTQHGSYVRYVNATRKIVGQLRRELKRELARADRRLRRGQTLDEILLEFSTRISPLSAFILAHHADRTDLIVRYRSEAENQHRSCPLYRLAARRLLPVHAYPCGMGDEFRETPSQDFYAFSRN